MDENGSVSTLNVTIPSAHDGRGGRIITRQQSDHKNGTSRSSVLPSAQQEMKESVRAIERCWCSYRDRQMFKLLKHAICAAEHSLTYEILRKVCPMEAILLKDPGIKTRVRFRFSGSEFPPVILFKIFTHTEGSGLKYLSGKRCIKPATRAASDACRMMGHRKFYDQMIADTCQHEQDRITDEVDVTTVKDYMQTASDAGMGHRKFYDQMIADTCQHEQDRITDEVDVTTVKDYMQYISNLDEMPAHIGGRDNLWRKLDLNALPRTTILYDIVDFLHRGSPSSRLRTEIPALTARPITQEIQLDHIRIISQLRSPAVHEVSSASPMKSAKAQQDPTKTSRRSHQAKQKVAKMRKMYMTSAMGGDSNPAHALTDRAADNLSAPGIGDKDFDRWEGEMDSGEEEEWEKEADQLYAWTKGLSYEDIDINSPCL